MIIKIKQKKREKSAPKNVNINEVKDYEQLKESEKIRKAINQVGLISMPSSDLMGCLANLENLAEADTGLLEEYLAIFIAWQNYYNNQSVIADIVSTVAQSQKNYYFSVGIKKEKGTISEKKELSRQSENYVIAEDVCNEAYALLQLLNMRFEDCDRAYKLCSRILTKRLGIKEWS